MTLRILAAGTLAVMASPAWAGAAVPGPDAGVGLGAMALMGIGYAVLRKFRRGR